MMTSPTKLCLMLIAINFCPQSALAASLLEAGAWEQQTTLSMQDPKTGKEKEVSHNTAKQCWTPDYIQQNPYLRPDLDLAKMAKKQADCTVSELLQSATEASWKMRCQTRDGHVVKVSIHNRVSARTIQSAAEQTVEKDGKSVFTKINLTAQHLGACTADMPKL